MTGYDTVIVQDDNNSSVATNSSSGTYQMSSASSCTRSLSSSSSRSYISSSGTTSHAAPQFPTPRCDIKRARIIGDTSNGGKKEFVQTGRPQGGNPSGGPEQLLDGYIRVNLGDKVIHNTGGRSKGHTRVHLGPEFGNGPDHCDECRDLSRWSDYQGLCFCPTD